MATKTLDPTNFTGLFDQAMQAFNETFKAGVKMQEDIANWWSEMLNSDAAEYGGDGYGNAGRAEAEPVPSHRRNYSLSLTLPPLSLLVFKKHHAPQP